MILIDIFSFLRSPSSFFDVGKNETIGRKLLLFKNAFILCFLGSFTLFLFITVPIDSVLKSRFHISLIEDFQEHHKNFLASNSEMLVLIKTCALGPFVEECLFRLPLLTKSLKLRILLLLLLFEDLLPNRFQLDISIFWYSFILLIIFGSVQFSNNIAEENYPNINKKKSYNYMSWVLTVAFGLVHIYNFTPLNWSFIYLYPFYVLPQLVYGVVFSYLAIRNNSLLWPLLLHAFINSTSQIHKLLTELF